MHFALRCVPVAASLLVLESVVPARVPGPPVTAGYASPAVHLQHAQVAATVAQTVVPNVRGKTVEEARKILADTRLTLGDVVALPAAADAPPTPLIVRQYPAAGTHASIGTAMRVWVTQSASPIQPSSRVATPDLIGRVLDDSVSALLGARGLQLGTVASLASHQPPGTIVDQKPKADVEVDVGSRVDVAVAIAPPQTPTGRADVTVPDLLGRQEHQLRAILGASGLTLGRVARRADGRERGTVIAQMPDAGSRVKRGGHINVVVVDPQIGRSAGGTNRQQTPPWLPWALGAAAGAAAVLAGSRVVRRLKRGPAAAGLVRAEVSSRGFTSEIDNRANLVDAEVLFRASADRRPSTVAGDDLRVIAESRPGEP